MWLAIAIAAAGACTPSNTGGLDLHGRPHVAKKDPPPPSPSTSASSDPRAPDSNEAHRLSWQAIGCFIGGPWSEALGASGEERILADTKRCREIATGPLGAKPEDAVALDAVRNLDADVIARAITGLEAKYGDKRDEKLLQLVRGTADAGREAQGVRRAAEEMRKAKSKSPTDAQVKALAAKDALVALGKLGTEEGKLVQLVLAADRVESARGLDVRGKMLAASPGLEVVFGVAPPKTAGEVQQSEWVTYLAAVAKAAGHAPKTEPSASTDDQEQAAFTGVAQGFADRFEAVGAKLPQGVAKGAANGYATQLRAELADAAAKEKADASATKAKDDAKTKKDDKKKAAATKKP
jgi:hypothetical protein